VEARGAIVRALVVGPRQEILVITESGTVQRTSVDGISQMGRATQGVIVQRLRDGDRISAVAMVDSASVAGDGDGDGAEPLPFGGLSEIAPEVVPYVSADAAEAAAEQAAVDEPAPSALDEIMADTEDADESEDADAAEDDEEIEE
ncbi:MAG: gyrase subunit, partial [Gaiellales bacterium]|nr:gyrase subunit [Gaiellales bacterium]